MKHFNTFLLIIGLFFFGIMPACDKETPSIIEQESLVTLSDTVLKLRIDDVTVLTPIFKAAEVQAREYLWISDNPRIASITYDANYSATVTAHATGSTCVKLNWSGGTAASCTVYVSDNTIRILAIGNSFSEDAVEQYLYELANTEGIELIIGNMYIGGCTIKTHLNNALNNTPAYEYRKVVQGVKTNTSAKRISDALADEPWDYISLQQASPNSGQYATFAADLPALVNYVKNTIQTHQYKLILHQTWAYAQNSTHSGFANYNTNQLTMYNAIVDAVWKAAQLVGIDTIVPSGTAIQNGRTTYVGDNFNRDGYHLNYYVGRYTVACTWFEKLFGKNVIGNSWCPPMLTRDLANLAQHAAHYAVLEPTSITDMVDFKEIPPFRPDDPITLTQPVYISFGSPASGAVVPAPWVQITDHELGEVQNLTDVQGNPTRIWIKVVKNFHSSSNNGEEETNTSLNMPLVVSKSNFWGNAISYQSKTCPDGTLLIRNLKADQTYSFSFFGSRISSAGNKETKYKVVGQNADSVYVNANANKTIVCTVSNIQPTTDGDINIVVSAGPNNNQANRFYYLNAISIAPSE
jgi:hypothetical protein